jgi:hypothetical protein
MFVPRNGRRCTGVRRNLRFRVEPLEPRALRALVVAGVTGTEGFPFTGTVATFSDATGGVGGNRATINWGDGHAGDGTLTAAAGGGFNVVGTNTYAVPGTFLLTVTVSGQDAASAQGQATVAAVSPHATGTTITPTAGQAFTGVVASFTDAYPGLGAGDYVATIAWGDGHSTAGTIGANRDGGFDVVGTNVFDPSGSPRSITVTIVRARDGQSVTVSTNAAISGQANTLTGRLDPASDTGASHDDGITAINQPTFVGTAGAYSIVTLYGRRSDQAQPVALGQAIADAGGLWHLTVGPLPDGYYAMTASETPPASQPRPMVSLSPGTRLTIDTVPPAVVSASTGPRPGAVTLVFGDQFSGVDPASVTNPAHFALIRGGMRRVHPATVSIVPSARVRPTDPLTATLRLDEVPGRGMRGHRHTRAVALARVDDVAGNFVPNQSVPVVRRHRKPTGGTE